MVKKNNFILRQNCTQKSPSQPKSYLRGDGLFWFGLVLSKMSWSPFGCITWLVKHLNWYMSEEALEGHGSPVHPVLDAVSPIYEPVNLYWW